MHSQVILQLLNRDLGTPVQYIQMQAHLLTLIWQQTATSAELNSCLSHNDYVETVFASSVGSIPGDWYSTPLLQSMDLAGNRLSGKIPAGAEYPTSWADSLLACVTDTAAMRRLSLATNLLTGTIPPGLWRFRLQACLPVPDIYSCITAYYSSHLACDTPHVHVHCAVIVVEHACAGVSVPIDVMLPLHSQAASGTAPLLLQACTMLQEVDLSNNKLSGAVPVTVNYCQDLRTLDLSNNSLTGSLPQLYTTDRLKVL